jgi:flagellar biosynthetic protein FlhB
MTSELGDKIHPATPYRRAEARRQGQVARSTELSAAAMCLAAVLLLRYGGGDLAAALASMLASALDSTSSTAVAVASLWSVGKSLAPIAAGLLLIGLAVNLVQTGFIFTRRKDAHPLNPFAGIERLLSGRSFFGGVMSVVKLGIVAAVAYVALRGQIVALAGLQSRPASEAIFAGFGLVYAVAIRVIIALLALAAIDFTYQRFRHERDLRMTLREMKDETRRQEGDPDMKRRRRSVAAAWVASRLQRDVTGADVVVTAAGDTVAVAMRFDPQTMIAPRVVAKGQGSAARHIREAAIEKGIPLVERASLAASLASAVGISRDVPVHFHEEVAELFAYIRTIERETPRAGVRGYERLGLA